MNKNKILMLWMLVIVISCKNDSCRGIYKLNFSEINPEKLDIVSSFEDTIDVMVMLEDNTIRDKYHLKNKCIIEYSFYDNSSSDNSLKFKISVKENQSIEYFGKSIYVVSKSFNNKKTNCIGDTIELLIRASNPIFLKNKLIVKKNNNFITEDYSFDVNNDELALFSILNDSSDIFYTLYYQLYSKELHCSHIDTINFSIKAYDCNL